MTAKVGIVVDMDVKGERELKSATSQLENIEGAGKRGASGLASLTKGLAVAGVALGAAAVAAKQAYEFIGEGASLEAARGRFENLTGTINTTSDALLTKLRGATKGMVSDAELIAGASDIISLGLAKTEDDTVRLATAVSTLGLDMQQVILTFANNSKARLDSLGLSVEDVTRKTQELEANGFQGDAFDEAVLIALEEKMTLLGDASKTTAGQIQQLEASWANVTNSSKEWLALNMAPTINGMSQTVNALNGEVASNRSSWDNFKIIVGETGKALSGTDVVWGRMIESAKEGDEAIRAMNLAQETSIARAAEMTAFYQEQAAAASELAGSTDQVTYSQAELMAHLAGYSEVAGEASGAQAMLNAEINQANQATYAWKSANDDAGASVEEHSNKAQGLLERVAALEGSTTHTVNLSVFGLNDLERAQQLIQNASGFNANDQPNPYSTVGNEQIKQQQGDQYDQSSRFDDPNYATGTNGWQTVPGPIGAPVPTVLHGGELFNVIPVNQSGGGESSSRGNTVTISQVFNAPVTPQMAAMVQDSTASALIEAGIRGF